MVADKPDQAITFLCVSETEQAHTSFKLMSAPVQVHDFDLQGI